MKDLLNRLTAEFDDVDGWIRIVDAEWVADDLRLNVLAHCLRAENIA